MEKKRLGNSDMEFTPIGVGAWAMGGGGWEFAWGPQDDDESDRRHPRGAGPRRELDRHGRGLRAGPFRGSGGARAGRPLATGRTSSPSASACGTSSGEISGSAEGRFGPARVRGQPAAAEGGRHRPVPDSLARARRRISKKAGRRWRSCRKRARCAGSASPISTPQQMERVPQDRAGHFAAAALFGHLAGDRARDAAVLPGARHRRDRLFAHEIGPAYRHDDQGTRGRLSAGRFPAPRAGVSGAAAYPATWNWRS